MSYLIHILGEFTLTPQTLVLYTINIRRHQRDPIFVAKLKQKGEVMMNCSNTEERSVWVIKDQNNNLAHKGSIFKSSKDQYTYLSTRTFSRESRAYIHEYQAQSALDHLNSQKDLAVFNLNFSLEKAILSKLIKINKSYLGDNLVVLEKVVTTTPLKLIKTMPFSKPITEQSCESCKCNHCLIKFKQVI